MNKTLKPGWSYKKLDELGFVGRGKSKHRPRNDPSLYGGEHPFIQTAEVTASEFYITKYSQTYSDLGLAQSKIWDKNTLCIVNAGENTAETAILKFKACFPDSIIGFIADSEKSDVRFIKYYLTTIKPQLRSITKGATQDNLSVSKLLSFDILTPPLPIQRKIAGILSTYDDLIENNMRRIKILEEMARSLYREWFVNFRFPGHQQVKMIDSELGLIPEGWEVVKIGDVAEVGRGSSPRPIADQKYFEGGTIPWIKIADATKSGKYLYETKQKVNEYGASFSRLLPKGSLIIAASGTLGYTQLLGVDGCIHDGWLYLINFNGVEKEYLYYLFREQQQFFYNSAYGAAIQNVNTMILREMKILLPPSHIQKKFKQIISNNDKLLDNLGRKNLNLRKTRDLLLPKLISGEIDVENLDINTGNIAA
ncbi:restriction endonuclease subunit S [Planktothrix sp. FACHB-1355]|uniref:Restriction endonuclease subunit S n=1 Tax=Aerosakkonema funiforme FACHB-1375 TaxID=2949571 RepID=A0A926VJH9_9CYAN|nr:restriction endonuclease subunit S [Aerosakkonema funiforme]MBD2184969.1 restriction endonuclease subunit S [Aerosakkonema funiforme FACHB-1375]MBD3559088.1 restriction endonuclease subunit S [Planktothrix sp. FACHB-1355]